MISERIKRMEKEHVIRGKNGRQSHLMKDCFSKALNEFADLEQWEKLARSMAFAIENQEICVLPDDRIGGRVFQQERIEGKGFEEAPPFDCDGPAYREFLEAYPDAEELMAYQLIGGSNKGHIAWFFNRILELGVTGFCAKYEDALLHTKDEEAEHFYKGVLIMWDAVLVYNDKVADAYEKIGNHDLAERMKKVPRYPAETFLEAVQAFYMQHVMVMQENPYGGDSPGRLDYYLWPYLERDMKAGRCTLEEAKEIIDELFLLIDERLYGNDAWGESIVVGGTYPNGSSAVNPLTYIMVQSIMDMNVTHPCVYIRLPENPPEELLDLCAEYMMSGSNRAQILYDPAIIGALVNRGISYRDAVEYVCGGCMEIGIQGMSSDFLYNFVYNPAKILELMITGGVCLRTGKKVSAFKADKGLEAYADFDSFYQDFIKEAKRLTHISLHEQEFYSKYAEKKREIYLISSMIDDCLEKGRNMHAGGAKYYDYGGTPLALPNVADGLFAIKEAIFEKKICTAEEFVNALKADYQGYERLQMQLCAIPKYGMDNDEADGLAKQVVSDFADMFSSYRTRWGGTGKMIIFTFAYSPYAARILGATADGRNKGKGIAYGLTPQTSSMTEGITAALNSSCKMPYEKIAGGASTMWDFDSNWASKELIMALIKSFIGNNGQIFQGNVTSVEELEKAMEKPEDYGHLIVRVGGYSARFTSLTKALQLEVVKRIRTSA